MMKLRSSLFGVLSLALLMACSGSDHVAGGGGGEGSFVVQGSVDSSALPKLSTRMQGAGGGVTHVMAVNPSSANPERRLSTVASDGSFSLELDPGVPWVLVFIDETQTGEDMIVGIFRASDLDTLAAPEEDTTVDLDTVEINETTHVAESSVAYSGLIDALGLDSDTAEALGTIDDLCLRYVNPDIDGNGEIDLNEPNRNFILDFHVRYDLSIANASAQVEDLVGEFPDFADVDTSYSTTGVYVAYPSAFSSASTGTATFETDVITEESGGMTFAAGNAISDVTTNNFGDYKGFGPNLTSASDLPQGEAVFDFSGKTLTFTNILAPATADLAAGTDRIFPFIRFHKADSGCASNCAIDGLDYRWMKRTASGWELASEEELALLVSDDGGYVSILFENEDDKGLGVSLPKDAAEGSVDWSYDALNESGLSESEFNALTDHQICHLGLSYDDKLGMRYFLNIANTTGTCL